MVDDLRVHDRGVVSVTPRVRQVQGERLQRCEDRKIFARWLQWLSHSSNPRSADIAKWYLSQLTQAEFGADDFSPFPTEPLEEVQQSAALETGSVGLVSYFDPQIERLRNQVAAARARLAEIESDYTRDRTAVAATQSKLFTLVKDHYQKRDQLRLLVNYRRKYLKILLAAGEDEAAEVTDDYKSAKAQSDLAYEQAANAATGKDALTGAEEAEIKALWKKLVPLYHPDRFASKRDSADTYENLIKVINQARDDGNLNLLREIADDPTSFIIKQGWTALDFSEEKELKALQKLLASLQAEILTKLEALGTLRESADYELCKLSNRQPGLLDEAAADLTRTIFVEVGSWKPKPNSSSRKSTN